MRRMLRVLVAAASMLLLVSGVAAADTATATTDFEAFHVCMPPQPVFAPCGTVNGQDGWKSAVPGDIPSLPNGYDQQVVANSGAPPEFGGQSLRISNGYGTGPATFPPEFHYQTYSKPTTEAAGEGLANKEYTAQFSFISVHPDQVQPGLRVSVSPDMGEGGRMSYIGLDDSADPDGVNVTFYDTTADGDFAGYDLGTLPRGVPHTIKFWMKLNPGPSNDLVRIYIDGKDAGQCFTTWEDFYRATSQDVPISDRLLFLSGNRDGDRPSLVGGGYLFDNVRVTTADGPGPPGCDLPIVKTADRRMVLASSLVGYRITVRNRGRVSERNLLVCDHIPRRMTFVSADRKLRRLGRRRCLFISRLGPGKRVSFHLVLRVSANAPQGRMDNTADITPPPALPEAGGPNLPATPGAPSKPVVKPPPIMRAKAIVRVIKVVSVKPPRSTG